MTSTTSHISHQWRFGMTLWASSLLILVSAAHARGVEPDGSSQTTSRPTDATSRPVSPSPLGDAELQACLRQIGARDFAGARRTLEPAIAAHPDWARGQLLMAVTWHKEKRYAQARPYFARAWELNPYDPAVASFYGWCLYYLGEPAEAHKLFEQDIRLHPRHADSHFALGVIALESDDLTVARRELDTAIQLAGRDRNLEGRTRIRLGDLFIRQEQWSDARRELEAAVALKSDAAGAYYKLSQVLQHLGDADGAARALEKHRELREKSGSSTSQPMSGASDDAS